MVKKIMGIIIICIVILLASLAIIKINNKQDDSKLKKIKVAEVAHSVFYAPQYVADGLGFFQEEGLDVELILANGADNVMSAVLSGDAQIGFSGTEATIYVYNGGEADYVMTFAGLTQKDLADKLFVTYQAVSRWENEDAEPSIDTIKEICGILYQIIQSFSPFPAFSCIFPPRTTP